MKWPKILYVIRLLYFIVQFFLLSLMLERFMYVKSFFYPFLVLYIIYVVKIIIELLQKKTKYQNDFIYNAMNIGYYLYITVIFVKIKLTDIFINNNAIIYFKLNMSIFMLLMIIILLYGHFELGKEKENGRGIKKVN